MRKALLISAVAGLALLTGAGLARWRQQPSPLSQPSPPAPANATTVWQASFPDLAGKPQALAQWRGKPLVLNFWATWCTPCREEMPEFVATQRALGDKVHFVGLAIDNRREVSQFVAELGIDYPILLGEQTAMDLMRAEGNRVGALPFTVIYDAEGRKVLAHAGRLDGTRLAAVLEPLL